MNAEKKDVASKVMPPKKKGGVKSNARAAAELGLKNAASDQEKTVARNVLKGVKFKELGRARVRRALKALDGIEKLASKAAYSWTEQEAEQLLGALTKRVQNVINRFAGQKTKEEDFDFKS